MTAEAYDLIVVGGGLIGAAAALGAGRQGRRVMLLERARPEAVSGRFGMDIRNVSLSPASRSLLTSLGIRGELQCAPFVGMHVWEEQGTEALDFSAADVDRQELGWIVENAHLVSALWAALDSLDTVDMVVGESLEQLAVEASCVEVTTDAGRYQGKLLVAVDGARSRVRHLLGLETVSYPTGHHALVTLLQTELPHRGIAHQRFLLDGPLALLPSTEPDCVSVVWSQSQEQAERRQALSDVEFCQEIGAACEHQLGEVIACDDRHVFPLFQHLVADFNPGQRLLLLGDAARVLHPLAGLGANVGFEDVRDFLDRLAQLPEGEDPGSRGIWKRFARHRRTRAQLMLGLMTALREVYSEDDPYLQWLRNLGVKLTATVTPVRRQVIREALGLGPLAGA